MVNEVVLATLLAELVVAALYWFDCITKNIALILVFAIILIAIAVKLILDKIELNSAKLQETKFFDFTFYFKSFNCDPSTIRDTVHKELTEADYNMLKSQPTTSYIEVYNTYNPSKTKKLPQLSFAGFALTHYAKDDVGIRKVLENLGYKKREIKQCDVVLRSMKTSNGLKKRQIMENLLAETWNYVENVKNTSGIAFMWEEKRKVACGVFIGEGAFQFKFGNIEQASMIQSEILESDHKKIN